MEVNNINSYNARHLRAEDIAKSFVMSNSFRKLLQNNHSIVLGARGCGKTTMMKMLTLPALYSWEHAEAKHIRESLSYYSIYVSTDIYWDVKNQSFAEQLNKFDNLELFISKFSVSSSIFLAICETLKNILLYEVEDNDMYKEFELCKTLITSWKLPIDIIPQIQYVSEALNDRIDEVNQIIQKLIFNNNTEYEFPDYFFLDFETSILKIISRFESIYDLTKKSWALCFDELEFAPLWLQDKLYTSLRSRDQRILYKLSSSPVLPSSLEDKFSSDYAPSVGNDFTLIKMWNQADELVFIQNLISTYVKNVNPNLDVRCLFGTNEIYNKETDSYVIGSDFHDKIIKLGEKDDSFVDFLRSKEIEIETVVFNKYFNDTIYRKIKPIVYFREFFISENRAEGVKLRKRKKSSDLYFGFEVVAKICDGNPRWLISLLNDLLLHSIVDGELSRAKQTDEIMRYSRRFLNVISSIPIESSSSFTFKNFINKVGLYFKQDILGPIFKMDPNNTFTVDKDISDDVLLLLEKGIAQGAFIIVNSGDEDLDFNLIGKRLKLSYLLYPMYYLPLRKYEAVKLKECLANSNEVDEAQMKLF